MNFTTTVTSASPDYVTQAGPEPGGLRPLLSADTYHVVMYGLSYTLVSTGAVGILSNILVLTTYLKMGFSDSINISYFALGISDLGVCITTSWGAITNLLVLSNAKIPFNAMEISTPTMFWPTEGLEKTTTCITAYITLEKCLSVLLPLHVKKFMTPKTTTAVLLILFLLVFGPSNLCFVYFEFRWMFDPARNETILRSLELIGPEYPSNQALSEALLMYFNSLVHPIGLILIWMCTIFLAVTLHRAIRDRESKFGQSKATEASQSRSIRVIKTVLLIAGAYLWFSTPRAVCNVIRPFEPEFHIRGVYFRSYMISIVVSVQLSLCNSTVNIFIYVYMSSKFREVMKKTFCS